jgi:hypothetical protein
VPLLAYVDPFLFNTILNKLDPHFVVPGEIERLFVANGKLHCGFEIILAGLAHVEFPEMEKGSRGNRIDHFFLAHIAVQVLHTTLLDCYR